MIIEYHRPETVEEALLLLSRDVPITLPMGGGTVIKQLYEVPIAVVDLQLLGLTMILTKGNHLEIGATATLQQMVAFDGLNSTLKKVVQLESTYNNRQAATVAGTLLAADGRSPFATAMLALDPEVGILPGDRKIPLGELLPLIKEALFHKLITHILLPTNPKLAFEYVARTPADLPIICIAVAQWPSGRTRLSMGGFGKSPIVAMDGPNSLGIVEAAKDAYHEAGDQWASAEYRGEIAGILTKRCLNTFRS